MILQKQYENWKLETDNDQILWLYADRKNSSVNTLNSEVISELADIVENIAKDSSLKGVIIASAKKQGFIAGADIEQFTKFKDEQEAFELVRGAQIVLNNLETLKIPTVAMIDGFCLGGGTELALACRYRVAEEGPKTRIGLPEVKLGIHPGFGGSIRLPRLIGAPMAMDLILSGRTVSGKAAAKMGIVDVAVPRRQLKHAVKYYVLQHPKPHHPTWLQALTDKKFIRPLLAKKFYAELAKKISRDHYPAPYVTVDNWMKYGVAGEAPMINEAKSIANLFLSETSKNLVRVFFLQDRMKGLAKSSDFKPQHVHVIGAGTMGGDIAAWCAAMGLNVTLQDREIKYIAPAIARAAKLYKEKFRNPRDAQAAMDRLMPDPQGLGIKEADVIIEAIFENLEAKQQLFKSLELQAKPTAILATNTSSIPLDEINVVLEHPEELVGIHFFNPAAKMQLVEVVAGAKTNPEVVNKALSFVRRIDRLPLPVKSSPGFLVNRTLMPYLMEAMRLLQEGVPAEVIDKAAVKFGMPMGPIELADTVGLDVCLSVADNLTKHFGGEVPERLRQMVKAGELGRKSGKGFYVYKNGKAVKAKASSTDMSPDLTDRLILRMVNEAVACLREGVVQDADLLDAGMIFGTGFAPFRGGPMHYAKTRGYQDIVARLQEFTDKYGERFKPDAGWQTLKN